MKEQAEAESLEGRAYGDLNALAHPHPPLSPSSTHPPKLHLHFPAWLWKMPSGSTARSYSTRCRLKTLAYRGKGPTSKWCSGLMLCGQTHTDSGMRTGTSQTIKKNKDVHSRVFCTRSSGTVGLMTATWLSQSLLFFSPLSSASLSLSFRAMIVTATRV